MKNNKNIKMISVMLFVVVIAFVLVAGTYSKYISSASGSDTATVAKWDIKAGKAGEELSITGDNASVTFDLFGTILDEDGTEESDVVNGKIAPGTMGEFDFSIKNDSEVNAEYTVNFVLSESNLPLEFRINDGEWTSNLNGVPTSKIEMGTSANANVQWRWAYEQINSDENDTSLGIDPKEVTVTATLVVSQLD